MKHGTTSIKRIAADAVSSNYSLQCRRRNRLRRLSLSCGKHVTLTWQLARNCFSFLVAFSRRLSFSLISKDWHRFLCTIFTVQNYSRYVSAAGNACTRSNGRSRIDKNFKRDAPLVIPEFLELRWTRDNLNSINGAWILRWKIIVNTLE